MVFFSRSGLPKSRFARFWQLSDLEKRPFDLGIENFALRNETSPSSFSTSEQVHSRGTEHIFLSFYRAMDLCISVDDLMREEVLEQLQLVRSTQSTEQLRKNLQVKL